MQRIRAALGRVRLPALALVAALVVGAVVIVLTDFEQLRRLPEDPIGAIGGALADMVAAYAAMLSGALGDPARIAAAIGGGATEDVAAALRPLSETLVSATPFVFAGLGLAVSFRAGLFNLGVDGQFLIGGLGASITAMLVAGHLPPYLALAVAVIGGTVAGGAYGFLPGLLRAASGAHEVITTIMLNGIAPSLAYLIAGWIGYSGQAGIPPVPRLSDLPMIRVDLGFVVALAMAPAVSWLLFRTTLGFELRTTGLSRAAARGAGIRTGRIIVIAMTLSGAFIGMGSAFFMFGPAWGTGGGPEAEFGYVAIALTLLGGRRPGGVVAAALLYGALSSGAENMVVASGIPLALITVIVAVAILFVAAPGLTRRLWRIRPPDGDAGPGPLAPDDSRAAI